MLVAAVAMFDSLDGALPSSATAGGLGGGFYPFWSAALILVTCAVVLVNAVRRPSSGKAPFAGREGVLSVLKLAIPMLLMATAMLWLGLYIVSVLFLAYFAWYIGRYRPQWVALISIATPLALYLVFEQGFKVPMPKSIFYTTLNWPF